MLISQVPFYPRGMPFKAGPPPCLSTCLPWLTVNYANIQACSQSKWCQVWTLRTLALVSCIYIIYFSLEYIVPYLVVCFTISYYAYLPHCRRACPSVGGCAPVWEGVPQCRRVFPSVGGCAPVWEGLPQYGRVCPSVGGCSPVWEGVPQYGRVFPSMGGCSPV